MLKSQLSGIDEKYNITNEFIAAQKEYIDIDQ